MDSLSYVEDFMDFIRLILGDKRFKAYAMDAMKLYHMVKPYAFLRAEGLSSARIDWERLRSHCEYFSVKLRFDKRQTVRQMKMPEVVRVLAELRHDEGFRRVLLHDIALAFSGYLSEALPVTLPPPAGHEP